MIDDGSSDGSREILEAYAEQDERFRFLPQPCNRGVSSARNRGLLEAKGDYVLFCDGDDWYEQNALAELLQATQSEPKTELVIADYFYSSDTESEHRHLLPSDLDVNDKKALFARTNLCSAAKLISLDLIRRHQLHFYEGVRLNEEMGLVVLATLYSAQTRYLPVPLYHYYQREGSASRNVKGMNFDDFDQAILRFDASLPEGAYEAERCYHFIRNILYGKCLNLAKAGAPKKAFVEAEGFVRQRFPEWTKNPYRPHLGRAKNLFLTCLSWHWIWPLRLMAYAHNKLV